MRAMHPEAFDAVVGKSLPEAFAVLADGCAAGRWGIEALSTFSRCRRDGVEPARAHVAPLPVSMLEEIRSRPQENPASLVYRGVADGRWSMEDAERWENARAALAERALLGPRTRPVRAAYLTRNARTASNTSPAGRLTLKRSLDATLDWNLTDGAKSCLDLICSLAGRTATLRTFTASLANQIGRTRRTVQNYYAQLEAGGYISRSHDQRTGIVTITLKPRCLPAAYVPDRAERALAEARRSPSVAAREAVDDLVRVAEAVRTGLERVPEGAKAISPFNLQSHEIEPTAQSDTKRRFFSPSVPPKAAGTGTPSTSWTIGTVFPRQRWHRRTRPEGGSGGWSPPSPALRSVGRSGAPAIRRESVEGSAVPDDFHPPQAPISGPLGAEGSRTSARRTSATNIAITAPDTAACQAVGHSSTAPVQPRPVTAATNPARGPIAGLRNPPGQAAQTAATARGTTSHARGAETERMAAPTAATTAGATVAAMLKAWRAGLEQTR